MTAADFQAAGLYDPAAPDAAGRLRLLEWLVAQGATVADMQEAQRRWGGLTGVAGDLILRAGERLTVAELAERSGLPASRIEEINLAVGLPPTAPGARAFRAETVMAYAAIATGEKLFGPMPMLHFVRVLGSALTRIAEAAVALFIANVEGPIVARGEGDLALAQANQRAIRTLDVIPNALAPMLLSQMELAIRRLRSSRTERAMRDTVQMTVGFVDLVGYTRIAQQLDAQALGALIERFVALASDAVAARDGRVVKLVGDAVMFVAIDPGAACDIALTLVERFAGDRDVTPRGGLAEGLLLSRGGDYYGAAVNLAARIADLAVPREVLVTDSVVADAAPRFRFEPAGRRILKGFEAPVSLFAVERA